MDKRAFQTTVLLRAIDIMGDGKYRTSEEIDHIKKQIEQEIRKNPFYVKGK